MSDDKADSVRYKPWTDRVVHFTLYPREAADHVEPLLDALVEHYWERPGWRKRLVEPSIGSVDGVLHITGLPRWMPGWWARRVVANIAHRNNIGGVATFATERVIL